ncbi:uncharacterized protein CANTADRAFT_21847 [Suhomyces tanzawaensis NRRL Y-17324]|uniref:WW domain-containing protein n=1 Tax=Suhomyces tanzawaensis NRRL Y-17324 TaxID=984487 RepID=A0A1E4SI05_9ASCO|nr:uncharacterized protein CANTADRAFT_21847 [Suhomyces tanzawaensis NRRL Y-17324]ODV79077.1 hypothetical protein CANTADRAFT_21847 [Suhomyces tanzawaensis NRRL Y-17324]
METVNSWTVKYDPLLNQHYYYNESEDIVSFDSPCEVKRLTPKPQSPKHKLMLLLKRTSSCSKCKKSRSNVMARLGSAFVPAKSDPQENPLPSLSSSVSNSTTDSAEPAENLHHFHTNQTLGGLDDEFLINNVHDFRNFAGTSFKPEYESAADSYSIDSMSSEEESITSFSEDNYAYVRNLDHKNSNSYSYNDYHYYYDDQPDLDKSMSDMESERRELRMQIMKELDY